MRRYRLSRLAIWCSAFLTTLVLISCVALKYVPDAMASRAEELATTALSGKDPKALVGLYAGIERWTKFSDHVAVGVGTLIVGGTVLFFFGAYRYVLLPLFALAASMKRFTRGERTARAKPSPCFELATAADTFNEMADIITGQHERMLDFIGATTLELKEPVHIMRDALKDFGPNARPPPEPMIRQRLTVVWRELDLERLVDNYLDASRIEWRRLDLQQDRQDLRAIVQQVNRLYEAFSNKHRIDLYLPEQPVWVFADLERIAQVIHTLLTNAIAFSPRGGAVEVRLVVEGDESADKGEATLSVIDHGIGISEQDLATIFEPFQKVSSALQNSPGVAVALSVARRIVQAHRGRLSVASKLGAGSTFRVHLPLAVPLHEEEALAGHAAKQEGPGPCPPKAGHPRAASTLRESASG
jgi:signal transduction histidine kinase